MSVWERFDDIATKDEVEDAKSKYAIIPAGTYELKLEKLEASESNKGLPMIKGRFRRVEDGKLIGYMQNLQVADYPDITADNIANSCIFLSGLKGEEVEYDGMIKFEKEINSIPVGGVSMIEIFYAKKDTEQKYSKMKFISNDMSAPFDT